MSIFFLKSFYIIGNLVVSEYNFTMYGTEKKISPTENNQREENDSKMKEISQDFVENCGLHGINKIRPGNTYRRCVSVNELFQNKPRTTTISCFPHTILMDKQRCLLIITT